MNRRYIPYIRKSYLKMQQSIINSPSVKTTDAFESVSDLTQVPSINNTIIDLELKTPFQTFTTEIDKQREIEGSINIWEKSVFVNFPKLQTPQRRGDVGEGFIQTICQELEIESSIDGLSNKQLGGGGKDGIIMGHTVEIKTAYQGSRSTSFQHELGEKPWLSDFMIFINVAPQCLYITIFKNFTEEVYKGHGKLAPVFPTKSVTWRKNEGAFKLDTTVAINETNCLGDYSHTFKLTAESKFDEKLKNFILRHIK